MVITSVWSTYGHAFLCDGGGINTCMHCGAVYQLVNLGGGRGKYAAAYGDAPFECSGDVERVHGYPGERVCEADNGRQCEVCADGGRCRRVSHDCNCLLCQ